MNADHSGTIQVSIILVNWNAANLTIACLDSIHRTIPSALPVEIILVDNGSNPEELQKLHASAAEYPFFLIENENNLGFAKANNQAIALARGRYVFLLNNDTELLDNALTALVGFMDEHTDVGIAGARLIGGDGRLQFSHDFFPLAPWRLAMERILDIVWPGNSWTRKNRLNLKAKDPEDDAEVDWILGAAMIVRREVIQQVGPFDDGYYMYGEDIDWCYRIKKAGWRVMYVPHASIIHIGGGSSAKRPDLAGRLIHLRNKSLIRFYRLHYGPAAAFGMWLILKNKGHSQLPTAGSE